jgi:excisionase family DNA binding protein
MSGREANNSAVLEIEPLINAVEAARLLKIHPVTLAEMPRNGRIPAIKIGRVWRFRPSRLLQWLDDQEKKRG